MCGLLVVEGQSPKERKVNMEKRYYIAYGSNLNVVQMLARCPGARVIGISEIPNYQLLFKGSKTGSYLTIEPLDGSSVPVVAWEISAQDERALDIYEGYPSFYYKKEMELPIRGIRTGKVNQRKVFVYVMHENRLLGIPSKHYLRVCLDGYRAFGFDPSFLDQALAISREATK